MYSILSTFCACSLAVAAPFALTDQSLPDGEVLSSVPVLISLSPSAPHSQDTSQTGELPSSDEFVEVDEEPAFDEPELYGKLKYPEEAARNNIEGKVQIRAYIDSTGVVRSSFFEQSTNRIFEQTVLDAVTTTRFIPARFKGKPIGVWMSIPITFRLRDAEPEEEKEEGK